MNLPENPNADIMRLVLAVGFCMGALFGVFVTGMIVVIHR